VADRRASAFPAGLAAGKHDNPEIRVRKILAAYARDSILDFDEIAPLEVNTKGRSGDSPLHIACRHGDIDDVIDLLEAGAAVNAVGDKQQLPIDLAAVRGNLELVRILFAYGAATDHRNDFNTDAMECAAQNEFHEVVRFFERFHRAFQITNV
jgi:ankyrin repeat protein